MNFFSYSCMLAAIPQMCKVLSVTFRGKKEVTRGKGTSESGIGVIAGMSNLVTPRSSRGFSDQ